MHMTVRSRHLLLVGSALALWDSGPCAAATIEAMSRIDSVVVYPDAAAVTRAVEVDLPAGTSTLTFRELPLAVDPASLRITGAAASKLSVGAVESRVMPATESAADNPVEAKIKALRLEREALQSALDGLEAKKAMMIRFSQAGPEKLSPESKPLEISQWSAAWDAVGQGLSKIGDELVVKRRRAREIDEEIQGLELARQRSQPVRQASREASVTIDAEAATKGTLALAYRVSGAGWQPQYDARLETNVGAKASLELVLRASITQRSGEDWNGVSLSVSTMRTRRGAQAPDVLTQRMSFYEPAPMSNAAARSAPAAAPMLKGRMLDEMQAPAPAPAEAPKRDAEERQAALDSGSFQASFQIAGRVDVPTDGSSKSFRISTLKVSPELIVRTAPVLDEAAFLQARIAIGDAALLPGVVNIIRDGDFVGISRIGFVAPGDSTDIGFGADDRVKVSRIAVKRKENEPTWLGSTKTEQREFKTTVKNLHPFAVKVNVVDRVPISENSAIVIEQAQATTPPTEKTVNDRRGVMAWSLDLAPNEERSVTLAYRMKWPADREVVFDTLPGGGSAR